MKKLSGILAICMAASLWAAQIGVKDAAFLGSRGSGITDWAQRVVNNGGTIPSPNTIACMETLRTTLIAQGITNKIYGLCVFVPDSVIASATPLFLHKGYPMWTNNFVSGDLNINGLKGDGTSKAMDTGITAQQAATNLNNQIGRGLTVVVSESATNQDCTTIGFQDPDASPHQLLRVSSQGVDTWAYNDNVGSQILTTNDFARVGYISGNLFTNASGTNAVIYVASPLETHKTLASLIRLNALGPPGIVINLSVFAMNNGTNSQWSAQRLSVAMVNEGFTATESSNVWNALKACRECLGGGTGDPVHEWAKRVVDFGGAAISTSTSNALRTFRQGLDTDGNLYSLIAVNTHPPDNLTANRLPFIWQAGNQAWVNVAFGETNVSVNGLTGNGTTKYLNTGINLSTLTHYGFGDANVGQSMLIFAAPVPVINLGASGNAVNGLFGVVNSVGFAQWYSWRHTTTINTDWLARAIVAGFNGYLSGNRTAANATRLDWVTNLVHNICTNGTGVNASTRGTMTNLFEFATALNNNNPSAFSDNTVAFSSLHIGLTQTASSNLWNRVANLRTNYGGGIP